MDIETYREIFGYYTAQDVVETLPAEQKALLAASEDDAFQRRGHLLHGSGPAHRWPSSRTRSRPGPKVTHTIELRHRGLQLRLRPAETGPGPGRAVARMKQIVKDNNLPVKVLSWKTGLGPGGLNLRHPADHPHGVRGPAVLRGHHHHHEHAEHERPGAHGGVRHDARRGRAEDVHHAGCSWRRPSPFRSSSAESGILLGVIVTWIVRAAAHRVGRKRDLGAALRRARYSGPSWGRRASSSASSAWASSRCSRCSTPLAWRGRSRRLDAINRH